MLHLRKREDSGHKFLLEAPSSKLSQLCRKIRDLGGCYIDSKYFEKSATHLVTDAIRCSEKFLGACVRGLWVLTPKYIEDSFEVGLWLDEEDYEYSLSDIDQPSDLIAAAKRWRWKVSNFQEHPFSGMQVALAMESNAIFYEKLLLYGGAQICKLPFPLHKDIHLPDISFVFMDLTYKQHAARLTEHGLICLHYLYITDSIIKDEELDILNYMIRDGANISDSLNRKLYHLTGQKQTRILDINLDNQTNILEIKVDNNLSGINLTVDCESVPLNGLNTKQQNEQQNDITDTSYSSDLSTKSKIKVVPNHSKSILNKTKYELSKSLNNGTELNKLTMLQTEDGSELTSKEILTKTQVHLQTGNSQPDFSINKIKNISRVLSVPGQKRKLAEANNYEYGVPVSKKCHLDRSLNNMASDKVVYTSRATKTGIKLSILRKSGKHKSEYQNKRKQDQHLYPVENDSSNKTIPETNVGREKIDKQNNAVKVVNKKSPKSKSQGNLKPSQGTSQHHVIASEFARKLVSRAKKGSVRNRKQRVFQPKTLPLAQVNVHLGDLDEQADDLHMPTTKVDSEKNETFIKSHKTQRKHHLMDEIEHKSAYVHSNNCNNSGGSSDLEICSTMGEDSKVFNSVNDPLKNQSAVGLQSAYNNKYRSLWSDSIANICTEIPPQQIKQENCRSESLMINVYLNGLNPTISSPPTKGKQICSEIQMPASKAKIVSSPSSISHMSKRFQTSLDRFGFSPLKKGKNINKNNALSIDQSAPSSNEFSNRRQDESTKPLPITADTQRTKRGLAKKKDAGAFVSMTDLTVNESLPLPQSDGNYYISSAVNETQYSLIDISTDDSNIGAKYSNIKMNDSPSKSPCVVSLLHETIANDAALDHSKPTRNSSSENGCNSSMLVAEKQELSTCFMAGASTPEKTIFRSESVSDEKLKTATNQEYSKSDRSFFESFSKLIKGMKAKTTNGCSSGPLLEDTQKTGIFSCSQSILPTEKNVLARIDPFQKDDISDELPLSARCPVDDCIDLPTPPPVISSESDTEDTHDFTADEESNELSFIDKPCIARTFSRAPEVFKQLSSRSEKELCGKNNFPIEIVKNPVLCAWPLTYPLCSNASFYTDKPFLPYIYGKWMESAREMGLRDYAINHAIPTSSKAPTSLLLSELVQLVWWEDVHPEVMTYLYTWLGLHPPVTSVTINLYIEAFELTSESSVLNGIVRSVSEESKHTSAVLLLEYFVSLFEVNFNFCLNSKNKNLIKNCLIIKWIWGHSNAVACGGILHHLLRLFGDVFSAAQLDFRACKAACALLNMACECLRLASVQWVQANPMFTMDSVIALSHDLAKQMNSVRSPDSDRSKMVALSMFKPAWLRVLLTAILLSHYNQYLLSYPIHVNKISLSSIVSQFFFLVPQLEPRSGPDSKGKENLEQNCHLTYTSKPLEAMHDSTKIKIQKDTLTASKVNKRNGKGESAIHIACMRNKAEDLESLLAVPGADVNLRDNYGWTPLHEACNHGNYACAELLLKYVPKASVCSLPEQDQKLCKVEIDAAGPEGLTPLHDAIRSNKIDVCKLLLSYGGQKLLKSKTHHSLTAMDLAQSDEMKEVLSSFSESASYLNLSISQESDNVEVNIDAVKETAPQAQGYTELAGTDGRFVVSQTSWEKFLMLLMVLITSYNSVLESFQKSDQAFCLDTNDRDTLANMSTYIKLLKRHVRKLSRPEDFERLKFRLELFELL